jgi:DNA polymerase zeta
LQILHQSIDHALQIINNKHDDTSYVFKILPVRGIPFYGYHGDKQVFLKILLYAPENVKKLSDLLLSGAIMNETYQPHESHIPFPLQFMIDYNLYGMNFIHASSVKFRVKDLITDGGAHSINDDEDQPFSMPQSPISSTHSSNHSIIIPSQRVWDPWSLPKLVHRTII